MAEYNSKLHQLETFWAQRSRVQWLKLGDKNTKYFHTIAKLHTRHNYFHELQRPEGSMVSSLKDMYETAQSFFQNLFSNPGNAFPLMTYNLPTKLSSEDNQFLTSVPMNLKYVMLFFKLIQIKHLILMVILLNFNNFFGKS